MAEITAAYRKKPDLENLLLYPFFNDAITKAQSGWRASVGKAIQYGIPTPAFSTALAFYDGLRSERLPANLLQAQRDYFGAHTFKVLPGQENELLKKDEWIHINWTGRGGDVSSTTYDA